MHTRDLFLMAAVETVRKTGGSMQIVSEKPLVLEMKYPDGVVYRTKDTRPPLNPEKLHKTFKDKFATVRMLEGADITTPRTHFIAQGEILADNARKLHKVKAYKKTLEFIDSVGGFPVFIKPNTGSRGRDVFRLDGVGDLDAVLMNVVSKKKEDFVLQEACVGEEYRIIVIGGRIELALRKEPLKVTGDGNGTIRDLIEKRFKDLRKQGRKMSVAPDSPKIKSHLNKQGLSLKYVLENGREIVVLANKNLSDGASPVVCTDEIRAKYAGFCARLHEDLGIGYAGLDLMEDERSGKDNPRPSIIEINGTPKFRQFINSAIGHPKIVERIFLAGFALTHRLAKAQQLPDQPQKRLKKIHPKRPLM
jgi:glutathione synthase/RimK-type ligase-like ATP-grasp enzyme